MAQAYTAACTFLAHLVACRSCSSDLKAADCSNRTLIDYAQQELTRWGYSCHMVEVLPGKWNLYADLRPDLPVGLLLSGHSDTVPPDSAGWRSDPFCLTTRDGSLYGLGACDMKGALACFMALAQEIAVRKSKLRQSLTLLFTCEEETSMAGAWQAVSLVRPSALCIIGEPTSLTPVIAHKGYAARTLTIKGRSAHSSNPRAGRNAITGLKLALDCLDKVAARLASELDPGYSVPYATLNYGLVSGGQCINQICAQVDLSFDLRPLHYGTQEDLNAMLQAALAPVRQAGFEFALTVPYVDVPALEQDISPLLQDFVKLCPQKPCKVNYCTEGSILKACAQAVVVCGPGSIDKAHQIDECVPQSDLRAYVKLLQDVSLQVLF